jgi:hypothetical protein
MIFDDFRLPPFPGWQISTLYSLALNKQKTHNVLPGKYIQKSTSCLTLTKYNYFELPIVFLHSTLFHKKFCKFTLCAHLLNQNFELKLLHFALRFGHSCTLCFMLWAELLWNSPQVICTLFRNLKGKRKFHHKIWPFQLRLIFYQGLVLTTKILWKIILIFVRFFDW